MVGNIKFSTTGDIMKKKTKRSRKRLSVDKHTVRNLSRDNLRDIIGFGPPTDDCTLVTCISCEGGACA